MDTESSFQTPLYLFRLYVCDSSSSSLTAIRNIIFFCKTHLEGHYQLKIVDLSLDPEAGKEDSIISAPTLVRLSPLPKKKITGDFSDQLLLFQNLGIDRPAHE